MNDEDPESRAGSGWRATWCATRPAPPATGARRGPLEDDLVAAGVVGIAGVDTRALTRHLRERGAMRCGIATATPRSAADGGEPRGIAPGTCWPARAQP